MLHVHFQVASLDPPTVPRLTSGGGWTVPQEGCTLMDLHVGEMPLPGESVLMVTLTLLLIFPHIEHIEYSDRGWRKVAAAINLFKQFVNCSSKKFPLAQPWSKADNTPRSCTRKCYLIKKHSEVPEPTQTITPFCILHVTHKLCCGLLALFHLTKQNIM